MSKYRTDSLFAEMGMDSRCRGNDNGAACNHTIWVDFESESL